MLLHKWIASWASSVCTATICVGGTFITCSVKKELFEEVDLKTIEVCFLNLAVFSEITYLFAILPLGLQVPS